MPDQLLLSTCWSTAQPVEILTLTQAKDPDTAGDLVDDYAVVVARSRFAAERIAWKWETGT